MTTLARFFCVAAVSIGTAACMGREDDGRDNAGVNDIADTTGSTDTTGATTDVADIVGAPDETNRAELPATASPLAMTGLIGLLSLGGAIALRALAGRGTSIHR